MLQCMIKCNVADRDQYQLLQVGRCCNADPAAHPMDVLTIPIVLRLSARVRVAQGRRPVCVLCTNCDLWAALGPLIEVLILRVSTATSQ